ncbi:MAG: sulfite exporter TauE/SafE family protein [Acidobacteriota bacterium]
MSPKNILLLALAGLTIFYIADWAYLAVKRLRAGGHGSDEPVRPTAIHLTIGFVTNFFDTLGIGSFATTTAAYKFWKLIPDEQIPGTLNVGHAINSIIQSFIYITIINVEFQTLFLMIAAATLGAWLGAGIVAGLPRRKVQLGMGTALIGAATIMFLQLMSLVPGGGEAEALSGVKLALGLGGNFMLGAFMTIGIGLYAPCMILVSMLGMNPTAAFPIMMGSCAFLMPVASLQFVRKNAYNLRAAISLAVGGPLAVLIAAFIVRSLPLYAVRWLVVFVVVYTAWSLLRSAAAERARAQVAGATV